MMIDLIIKQLLKLFMYKRPSLFVQSVNEEEQLLKYFFKTS